MTFPPTAMMIRIFRGLAIAEAFSWAALLFGMVLKWVTKTTELGVEIAGPIHGAFFIGYAIAALSLWAKLRWPFRVALLSGLSAVFPFATVWFERWAGRRGHLNVAGVAPQGSQPGSKQSEVTETSDRDDDTVFTRV
jgi:integral membrane protein